MKNKKKISCKNRGIYFIFDGKGTKFLSDNGEYNQGVEDSPQGRYLRSTGEWVDANYLDLREYNLNIKHAVGEDKSLIRSEINASYGCTGNTNPVVYSDKNIIREYSYVIQDDPTDEKPIILWFNNNTINDKSIQTCLTWYGDDYKNLTVNKDTIEFVNHDSDVINPIKFDFIYSSWGASAYITHNVDDGYPDGKFGVKFGSGNIFKGTTLCWRWLNYWDYDVYDQLFTGQGKFSDYFTDNLIGKFKDKTKNFQTFFDKSGLYRCFGMTDNLPTGYNVGDNDFYVNVFDTSQNYKILEALDIRSGRRHTLQMYNGDWKPWIEPNLPLIPKSIYKDDGVPTGARQLLELNILGITEKDSIIVNCGSRGIAVRVDNIDLLERYSASYHISDTDGEFIYFLDPDGSSKTLIEILKFVPVVPEAPIPWKPYLRLNGVDDISISTPLLTKVYLDLEAMSWELVRLPFVVIRTSIGEFKSMLIFDGKERYYFEWNIDSSKLTQGSEIEYHLVWDDQIGGQYTGEQVVTKTIN